MGFAFHWEDMFDLGEVWDAFASIRNGFDPTEMATLVVTLLEAWRKLRGVRVPLSKTEFLVLRAVRRGHSDLARVAAYVKLPEEVVSQAIESLKSKRYKREVPLLSATASGFTSEF